MACVIKGFTDKLVILCGYTQPAFKTDILVTVHMIVLTNNNYVRKFRSNSFHLSHLVRKPTMWFQNRSNTNKAVQLQMMAGGLKCRI